AVELVELLGTRAVQGLDQAVARHVGLHASLSYGLECAGRNTQARHACETTQVSCYEVPMRRPDGPEVVILGGGLTGISGARHLTRRWLLIEKNDRLGGHARTDAHDGYFFDKTGHWLHLRDPYTKQLIADLLGDTMVRVERRARIFSNGVLT